MKLLFKCLNLKHYVKSILAIYEKISMSQFRIVIINI